MKNKSDFRRMIVEACILFGITLAAGLVLGFVYELTKEPIAYQQELKIQRACTAVFEEAAFFEEMPNLDAAPYNGGLADTNGVELGKVYRALAADSTLLGYVIDTVSTEGYGGDIELMLGIALDGTLKGISILSISETPGLGMQAEEVLVPQFAGRTADAFSYTKAGASADNQIDAISGATITTKAVTNAVNAGLNYFHTVLQEGGN